MAQASAQADSAAHAPSITDLPRWVSDRLVVASTHTRILILPRVGSSTRFSVLAEIFPHPAIAAACASLDTQLSTRQFGETFALLHRVSFAVFAQQALRKIVRKALTLRLVSTVFESSLPAAGLGDLHRTCAARISWVADPTAQQARRVHGAARPRPGLEEPYSSVPLSGTRLQQLLSCEL
jgi:hypothetical protein